MFSRTAIAVTACSDFLDKGKIIELAFSFICMWTRARAYGAQVVVLTK